MRGAAGVAGEADFTAAADAAEAAGASTLAAVVRAVAMGSAKVVFMMLLSVERFEREPCGRMVDQRFRACAVEQAGTVVSVAMQDPALIARRSQGVEPWRAMATAPPESAADAVIVV